MRNCARSATGWQMPSHSRVMPRRRWQFWRKAHRKRPAATDLVGQATQALSALAKIDSAQHELANQAELLLDTMSDLIHSLRDYLEEIEFNPKRLDAVEERLDLI